MDLLKFAKKYSLKGVLFISILLGSIQLHAQSDNYWSWNYNTPSTLLAGSVVGGSAGPSAIFYNPALIDHENVPSFSISASLVSFQFFKAENIAGEGINGDKFIFKIQPRFLSYVIANKNERLGMEVAILSPVSEDMRYTVQYIDELDLIERTEGLETYSGYLNYDRKYDETLAGFGLSYQISDNFFIGASSFLSIKLLKYQYQQNNQAYQNKDSVLVNQQLEAQYVAQNTFEEEMKYWDLSFIFKVGGQYKSDNDRLSLGLNLTFPNIPFIGQADIRKSYNRSNVYNNESGKFTPNEIFVQVETDVKTNIKNPFSAAFGVQYFTTKRKNSISLTAEYFHHIDSYQLVETKNGLSDVPESMASVINGNDFMSYYFEARSLTNVAVGFKQYISPKFFFLGGLRTDFTAGTSDNVRFINDKFKVNQIHIDKYHLTLGPFFNLGNISVVTGIQYTFGSTKNMEQVINYSDPVEYNPSTGQSLEGVRQNTANAFINEVALFLGVSIDLN